MGLDINIVMCRNKKQVEDKEFWNNCKTGFLEDKDGIINFSIPCQVYYARKFWDFYEPVAYRLKVGNGEWSEPLTKEDIEFMINIATHNRDYWDEFNSVPMLCEILDHYDEATEAGMVFLFEGDY